MLLSCHLAYYRETTQHVTGSCRKIVYLGVSVVPFLDQWNAEAGRRTFIPCREMQARMLCPCCGWR